MNLQETKKTGDRRHCKHCKRYKPDRTHHCRVCRRCILKMDHHCPWIYNCVGYYNYKCFFLLLFYCVLDTHLIFWTMLESVLWTLEVDMYFINIFLIYFGVTLACFFGTLITAFFGFHTWLMLRAMTTIEFCEKSMPPKRQGSSPPLEEKSSFDSSVYDLGVWGNLQAVLGPDILLWCVPFGPMNGDGFTFVSDETRLSKDLTASKGHRRRTHQRVQRSQRQRSYHADTLRSTVSDSQKGLEETQ